MYHNVPMHLIAVSLVDLSSAAGKEEGESWVWHRPTPAMGS